MSGTGKRLGASLLVLVLLAGAGCYRTRYVQFAPRATGEPAAPLSHEKKGGWQSFFVWGWFPLWRDFDAGELCGGSEHVEAIATRRTFLEGLVAAVAGFYVNIYSPWDAAIHCRTPR